MPDHSVPDRSALAGRLADLRQRYPASDPNMVADVVRSVLSTMRGDLSSHETSLLHEVEELGEIIASARHEIAALQVDDITGTHIPSATDELDAIVAHTAVATNAILETCETLDELATISEGEAVTKLQDATTRIYEACSFQDITGQRITKVVATLKRIDAKVSHLISTFGRGGEIPPHREPESQPPESDAELLNGPQLPQNAMDQSDIDRLLASFD